MASVLYRTQYWEDSEICGSITTMKGRLRGKRHESANLKDYGVINCYTGSGRCSNDKGEIHSTMRLFLQPRYVAEVQILELITLTLDVIHAKRYYLNDDKLVQR